MNKLICCCSPSLNTENKALDEAARLLGEFYKFYGQHLAESGVKFIELMLVFNFKYQVPNTGATKKVITKIALQ